MASCPNQLSIRNRQTAEKFLGGGGKNLPRAEVRIRDRAKTPRWKNWDDSQRETRRSERVCRENRKGSRVSAITANENRDKKTATVWMRGPDGGLLERGQGEDQDAQ